MTAKRHSECINTIAFTLSQTSTFVVYHFILMASCRWARWQCFQAASRQSQDWNEKNLVPVLISARDACPCFCIPYWGFLALITLKWDSNQEFSVQMNPVWAPWGLNPLEKLHSFHRTRSGLQWFLVNGSPAKRQSQVTMPADTPCVPPRS